MLAASEEAARTAGAGKLLMRSPKKYQHSDCINRNTWIIEKRARRPNRRPIKRPMCTYLSRPWANLQPEKPRPEYYRRRGTTSLEVNRASVHLRDFKRTGEVERWAGRTLISLYWEFAGLSSFWYVKR